jgi:hypothetical protein
LSDSNDIEDEIESIKFNGEDYEANDIFSEDE